MKKLIQRLRNKLPKTMKDVWWHRSIWTDEVYPIVKWEEIGYLNCKEDLIVPMFDLGKDRYAYYKITKVNYRSGDWTYDGDGYKCDMEFELIRKGLGIAGYEKPNASGPQFIKCNP